MTDLMGGSFISFHFLTYFNISDTNVTLEENENVAW